MTLHPRSRQGLVLFTGLALLSVVLMGQGCPQPPSPAGFPGANIVSVLSPALDRSVSAGDPVTIVYSVASPSGLPVTIRAFYDRDGVPGSNDDVIFAANLLSGTNKVVQLDTSNLTPGQVYNVGISVQPFAGPAIWSYASGRIMVVAATALTFNSPVTNLAVGAGTQVPISFTPGQGVLVSSYRVFYDTDQSFNGNEITIQQSASQTSGTVQVNWDTTNLAPRTYYIGARVTTPESEQEIAYAPGAVTITEGAFLVILAPTGGGVFIAGDTIDVVFSAGSAAGGDPDVRVFIDRDVNATNSNDITLGTVSASTGFVTFDTSIVPESGLYYIGAELVGEAPSLIVYTSDAYQVITSGGIGPGGGGGSGGGTGSDRIRLRVPQVDRTVFTGEIVEIRWTTNLGIGEGTIALYREPDFDLDGQPDGVEERVLISPVGLDASTRTFNYDTSGVAGSYFIVAVVSKPGEPDETSYAAGRLNILRSVFWVGHLRTYGANEIEPIQTAVFEGATFRGHNIGDNLGSAMLLADDYASPTLNEPDNIREIVLVAKFGKPFFIGAGGRGVGEVYMIYGRSSRFLGDFDVNTIGAGSQPGGADALAGLIMAGIVPNPNPVNALGGRGLAGTSIPYTVDGQVALPYETEGIVSLTLIPDQDGDGKAEIAFGIPYCNSYSLRYQRADGTHPAPLSGMGSLENNGGFLRGGIVFLSSFTPMLRNPNQLSRHFDRVLHLHEVGQLFSPMGRSAVALDVCPCDPEPDGANDLRVWPQEGFRLDTLNPSVFPVFDMGDANALRIDPPRLADPIEAGGGGNPHGNPGFSQGAQMILAIAAETINITQIDAPPGLTDPGFLGGRIYPNDDDPPANCPTSTTDGSGLPLLPYGRFPVDGLMRLPQSGFYYDMRDPIDPPEGCGLEGAYEDYCGGTYRIASPRPPYGARLYGQTAAQPFADPPTIGNRFGARLAMSGEFLLVAAPNRTAVKTDITALRLDPFAGDRVDSGEIYMIQLNRANQPQWPADPDTSPPAFGNCLWNSTGRAIRRGEEGDPDATGPISFIDVPNQGLPDPIRQMEIVEESMGPAPHQYIIQDLGYTRCTPRRDLAPGDIGFELTRPFHIVGQPGDHIGEVTALLDLNGDGVTDFAVGGPMSNGDRGAVYVIFRRQPELEADYLLERLQLAPTNLNRLVGLFILGRPGEMLGTTLAGIGPRGDDETDDYNDDGFPDLLIGSPYASPGSGFRAGETFILFGDERAWLTPAGGSTIPELVAQDRGMVLQGEFANDQSGTTVTNPGDINGDGIADILIAAPNASPRFDSDGDGIRDTIGLDLDGDFAADDLDGDGSPDDLTGAGIVYVVFGGKHLKGAISLANIGTKLLPGFVLVGRSAGDHLGGGMTQDGAVANGVGTAGDLDGDGRDDLMVSSVLADPEGKTDAGEVYLIYGFDTPIEAADNP